jgi:hypothetical protein
MRSSLIIVAAGVLAAAVVAVTTASAQSANTTAADEPGSIVEDYQHPNQAGAAAIGMTLNKGNGKIFWVDCAVGGDLLTIESDSITTPNGIACFKVTGSDGYLAMSVNATYFIKAGSHKIQATLTSRVDGQEVKRDYSIKPGQLTPVGEPVHPDEGPAALVELRSVA